MGSSSRSKVYDEVRRCFVRATPEEIVRQRWLKAMIDQLEYPRELLVVEKMLQELPHLRGTEVPERRVDILCYGKAGDGLFPLLLIECKDEALTEKAINQVLGYNYHVKARFAGVVSRDEVRLGNKDVIYSHLPSFKELMQWAQQ
jgi:hypothetical protein